MKGIGIQFDSLTGVLQKNINDKQLIQSKDNFELVYEKVTQQTLKTMSVIIDNLSDNISLKLSFSKLLKQLKTFLSLKPINTDDEEEEHFKQEFDEVQEFMNSRKPVMNDVDTGQRGDIYKFLFQAENKEKDMQEFMGNMNKCNPQGNKKLQSTKYKWKKTLKTIHVITEDITVQTDLSMQVFEKLANKFPSLFKPSFSANNQQNENQLLQQIDIEAKIQQIVKQRLEQKAKAIEEQAVKQENEAKQNELKKKEIEAKKKKPNQAKRNTQTNLKRVSNVGVSFKAKSQLASKKQSISIEIKQIQEFLPAISELKTKTSTKQNTCLIPQSAVQDVEEKNNQKEQNKRMLNIDKLLPSYQSMFKTLSQLKDMEGVSNEQMKKIYQALRSQFADNISRNPQTNNVLSNFENSFASQSQLINQKLTMENNKLTEQKQVNTVLSYLDGTSHHEINKFNILDSKQNDLRFSNKCHPSYSLQARNQDSAWNQENYQPNFSLHQSIHQSFDPRKEKNENLRFKQSSNEAGNIYEVSKQSKIINEANTQKSQFPQISKGQKDTINRVQGKDSTDLLAKQGILAQEHLKKLKDTKYMKSLQNSKSINKQNYSLDMYKSKDILPKNKISQHVNLPSINRSTQNRAQMSLHEEVNDTGKNSFLQKLRKKTFHHSTIKDSALIIDKENQILHDSSMKKSKKDQMNDISREEEKIMKELEKISGENSGKLNMKNIAMYINFVQSIHLKRCGQKCVHLERFYEFLHRNNLPNRKQFQLHKADMNSNFNL